MLPTLAEVLELEAVQAGAPRVVAAPGGLGRPVRWAHAIELADAARLLRGGELVLSTGIALPDDPQPQARYVAELAAVGVAGLAVELGRKYAARLPAGLVTAARDRELPLIAFEREVRFVEITEAVHARIIDSQLTELRAATKVHEVFTGLSVAGASPAEIVEAAARLAGRPVVLADLTHTILASAGLDLAGFGDRSRGALARAVPAGQAGTGARTGRTVFDRETGWLITPVGVHGETWGRVILAAGRPPEPLNVMLAERAAAALALGRLQAQQRESLERQAHRTLIAAIVSPASAAGAEQAATRARALGLPTAGRQFIALVARLPAAGPGLSAQVRVLALADAMAAACRAEHVPAIVGSLDDLRAGALLSLTAGADPDPALTVISQRIQRAVPASHPYPAAGPDLSADPHPGAAAPDAGGSAAGLVLAAGSAAGSIQDAARSFAEARQVADAAAGPDALAGPAGQRGRPFLRLADLRLAGLLQLLRGDPRVQAFAEREVGPLLAYDAQHGTGLTAVLSAYLEAGGNKTLTAQRTHLARPTLYERLAHIERLLGASLDSPRSRASLHVALLAQGTSTAIRS